MDSEILNLDQLASLLRRDARELYKWANRGYLPGQKVAGEWRFASAEIQQWIEQQIPTYNDQELGNLEAGATSSIENQPLISVLLSEETTAVPLPASTKASVLREMVTLAEQSWQVYDPDAMFAAIRQREETGSTAQENGVALLHPRRPLSDTVQGEAFIAFGRTPRGIPFGGSHRGLTDLFFLVCCRSQKSHLQVLARLSRLLLREGFVDQLRQCETGPEAWHLIAATERELLEM